MNTIEFNEMNNVEIDILSIPLLLIDNNNINMINSSTSNNIPMSDVLLFNTHFIVKSIPINAIIKLVNNILDNLNNFNYYFNENHYMWEIKYSKGSITCNIQINIYKHNEEDDNEYIIESHRTYGNSLLFLKFYKKLKILIQISKIYHLYPIDQIINKIKNIYNFDLKEMDNNCNNILFNNLNESHNIELPPSPCYSNYEHFISGIYPINRMATQATNIESKLESSKMLYDLFDSNVYKNYHHLYDSELNKMFIEMLSVLLNNNMSEVKEYTVFAIKNFIKMERSEISGLIQWNVLKEILEIIKTETESNISFQTIQMRRECGFILLHFINKEEYKNKFIQQINENNFELEQWKSDVSNVKDIKLKKYIDEINNKL